MSFEPLHKRFRTGPKTLDVEGIYVNINTDIDDDDLETDNTCLPWKNGNTTGVVEISDEIEHNLYCELIQQLVEITSITNVTSSYNSSVEVSSNKCRPKTNNGRLKPHTIPELVIITDNDTNMYKKSNPKFCVEPFLALLVSKDSDSSIAVFYDMAENRYSIGLETDALDGLHPRKWVKENLFDVLLIQSLLRSERNDIICFETVWGKKIMLGNYSLDRLEYGIGSRIAKSIIIFPVLVDHHYIVLAYKEENGKGRIMEFDSMNHLHPIRKLSDLIQSFKTFITAKKKLTGKSIIFQPSVRILCPKQTNSYDCALYALKNCEWLINNLTNDISAEEISCSLPKYDEKEVLKDRAQLKRQIETLFCVADVNCNFQNEYLVSYLDGTLLDYGVRYFKVYWKSWEVPSWEPMTNLYCPALIIKHFEQNHRPIPVDVISYLDRFLDRQANLNNRGGHRRYNKKKLVGSRSSVEALESIPKTLISSPLPQPQLYIMDRGITYELVHPKRFIISQEIYDPGRLVNCFGAVMKHVWNISFNSPVIEKKDICKRIEQLSGCHLVELLLFSPNKVRKSIQTSGQGTTNS